MITAGIDIGAKTTKMIILDDGRVIAKSLLPTGIDTAESSIQALDEALSNANIAKHEVDRFMATGAGRKKCPFTKNEVTEVGAAAKGAHHLMGACRTVIDVGVEEGRAIRLDDKGRVKDFAFNEKCAAGTGAFAEAMARALEVTIEELGPFSLTAKEAVQMNAQCVVFAESEAVTLIHSKTPREEIARAVLDAIANRIIAMTRKMGLEKEIALVGGLAKNPGFVEGMKRGLDLEVHVLEDPEYVGALGAALAASSK